MRLLGFEFRGHRGAKIIGVGAFAIMTLAIVVSAASFSAWRASAATGTEKGAFAGGAELVAFLREDLPGAFRDDLALVLGRLPGVAGVRLMASDEALDRLRAELGDRGSVLDGVEEGFLPATMEVALQPGPQGVGRADAIAWRLRRMDGITEVDVLRTTTDQRLAQAEGIGRRFGGIGLAFGLATVLLAIGLVVAVTRRRRADARLLSGLGFTAGSIVLPSIVAGASCAGAGTLLGGLLVVAVRSFGVETGLDIFTLGSGAGAYWWSRALGGLTVAVALGAAIGWWGARLPRSAIEDLDLASAD